MIKHRLIFSLKLLSFFIITLLITPTSAFSQKGERWFYQLKIYQIKDQQQEEMVDHFLQKAYLPALHRQGIKSVGVFKPIEKDTLQKIYVLIPFRSLNQFEKLNQVLQGDQQYQSVGADYINAAHNNVPYRRIESILLKAFEGMPQPAKPKLTGPKKDRVYELRSYEGPTEKYYVNKVKMFNAGDEVGLFDRLGFNAIFYGEVLSGNKMPNLMYMTSFENKAARDEHWKAFGGDPEWKKLSADPQYKDNVSHIDITFLYPTEYSDF